MALRNENSSIPARLRTYGDMATRKMFRLTQAEGGTTVSLETFDVPAKVDGFFVGKAKGIRGQVIASRVIPAAEFSLKTLRNAFGEIYGEHHTYATLEAGAVVRDAYIGTWKDEDGSVHVDAVNWTADRSQAVLWGLERDELAIWDVAANAEIRLTGSQSDFIAA